MVTNIPMGRVIVIMCGASGAGKSTFVQNVFDSTDVVSTDDIRAELYGSPLGWNRKDCFPVVMEEFIHRIKIRASLNLRTVVDACNIKPSDLRNIVEMAEELSADTYVITLERPLEDKLLCADEANRSERAVRNMHEVWVSSDAQRKVYFKEISKKGVRVIEQPDATDVVAVQAHKYSMNPHDTAQELIADGYDYVRVCGDLHGDSAALDSFMSSLMPNEFPIFAGDLVDYGSDPWGIVSRVSSLVLSGRAMCVRGNHDAKMRRWLTKRADGTDGAMSINFGMQDSIDAYEDLGFKDRVVINRKHDILWSYTHDWIVLGDVCIAHAAVLPDMYASGTTYFQSGFLRHASMYGQTAKNTKSECGQYPARVYNWMNHLPEGKKAITGHQIINYVTPAKTRTTQGGEALFVDTGCSKGGRLSDVKVDLRSGEVTSQYGWVHRPQEHYPFCEELEESP